MFPERIVVAEDEAVHRRMRGARAPVHHRDVFPVRAKAHVLDHLRPAPGHVGRLKVGAVDRPQAPRAAGLNQARFAGRLVDLHLLSPPAVGAQPRLEVVDEIAQRDVAVDRRLDLVADVLEDVQARDAGNGERARVRLLPQIVPVVGDRIALRAEILDGALGRQPDRDAKISLRRLRHRRGPTDRPRRSRARAAPPGRSCPSAETLLPAWP